MITRNTILAEYPRLSQESLPAVLKQGEFDFLAENLDLYGQDETIDQFIDTFISKLNELAPAKKKPAKKQVYKTRKLTLRKANKTKFKPVKKNTKKAKKKSRKIAVHKVVKKKPVSTVAKPKIVRAAKTKREILSNLPEWLVALRKMTRMANKEYSQTTLRNYLAFIQKSFYFKRPGATTTPHIDIIRVIQENLVGAINKNIASKKILFKMPAHLVDEAAKINKAYLVKIDRKSKVSGKVLSGLKKKSEGLSGLHGLGVVNSQDLATMSFKNLQFTGKFKDLIGNPTIPFHIMMYGLPGSGKSTLAITFAKYLADEQNLKVLFLAKEEGISGTTQEKFIRLHAIHQNIDIAEKMPENLDKYDVLVIDSVNEMNMTPDHIRQIQSKYPNLSTVQIFKATKEGKFLGQSDFAHLCQAEIICFDGKAQARKNRFGGNRMIEI